MSEINKDYYESLHDRQEHYYYFHTPKGIRTPVASVKGRCPRPLDDGGEATTVRAVDFTLRKFVSPE